ncbi:multicomponent Na+:H+ antiporter subunit C [Rhodococcus triatomae]|uniref:Multicomponent Na+:H+ antiporter subunit C n=1 Tax=Rhodococcus triatomae TaxID=300028 RepID=A0A1G8AC64_9NOCA|nr:NADH-quinone oxidoreductase subunit K [Rhodococcus triatomae]SDH18554.1 multicomponent Na+:H+ antiporter subunit C [Rhodococcus triatomae]
MMRADWLVVPEWFMVIGALLFVLGATRLLLTEDLVRRIVALNVSGIGTLLILVGLAAYDPDTEPDPVLHALVLTGIVITVSVTGLALVLVRTIERAESAPGSDGTSGGGRDDAPDEWGAGR